MKDCKNYSLLSHNTFGIEAQCARFLEYTDEQEALQVATILRNTSSPYIIIGGGSNLLLTRDFEGIVVHSACKGIRREGNRLTCGSGEVFDDVVAESIKMGLYGAIRSIRAVEIATGHVCIFENAECEYGYRQSRFKQDWKNQYLIVSVEYQFSETFHPHLDYGNIRAELERQGIAEPTAQQLRQTIIDIRNAKLPDPKVQGNAGSFFMNPVVSRAKFESLQAEYPQMPHYTIDAEHEKIPAGWMIDQCGWKGKSLGRAGVHDKQALVLVNRGGATGQEIVDLCNTIRADVKEKFGIDIHPEVNIV